MNTSSANEVTDLLRAWGDGNDAAIDSVMPRVYAELHRAARQRMSRENPSHMLQATGLVNETFLRLVKLKKMYWQNRDHFFAVCSVLMRRILTDYARAQRTKGHAEVDFVFAERATKAISKCSLDFVALDEALNRLAVIDERQARVVQLRFFVGLTVKETAESLRVSERTVKQDWTLARLWLLRELKSKKDGQ